MGKKGAKRVATRLVRLLDLAHARSGDKGDAANVGLIALRPEYYPVLAKEVTAARVARHFRGVIKGPVERFELPNLHALNFLLHGALGGGGNDLPQDRCARKGPFNRTPSHGNQGSRRSPCPLSGS